MGIQECAFLISNLKFNSTYPVVVEALHGREGGALAGVRLVAADTFPGGAHSHEGGEQGELEHRSFAL